VRDRFLGRLEHCNLIVTDVEQRQYF